MIENVKRTAINLIITIFSAKQIFFQIFVENWNNAWCNSKTFFLLTQWQIESSITTFILLAICTHEIIRLPLRPSLWFNSLYQSTCNLACTLVPLFDITHVSKMDLNTVQIVQIVFIAHDILKLVSYYLFCRKYIFDSFCCFVLIITLGAESQHY